jgi:hypothetical protein
MKTLKEKYEDVCNEYVKKFCKKQGMSFEFWVDSVGGIVLCSDFYLNFLDIVWDINSNQPEDRIIDWYDDMIIKYPKETVNYFTYCKQITHNEDTQV